MKKGVAFKAAGVAYTLAFTTAAMEEYEETHDASFFSLAERFEENGGMNVRVGFLRELLEIGLRPNHPEISTSDAQGVVDDLGVFEVVGKITAAIGKTFPESKGGKVGNGVKSQAG